jgi:phosphoglycerate kinase
MPAMTSRRRLWGRLGEIYCNDAFALSHQIRASTVGVAKKAKRAVGGLAFERELSMLEAMLGQPRNPSLALLGGRFQGTSCCW